ncbi:hypothetical protein RJ639_009161 [Escallonia herrerae]|uniref:DUF547 domain-containing protein n=1 Tax=Escallonia herrerae TaxID=1293975 RepID=A0AA88VVH7_9ASTE|nr:hypothetical protein RJ639_009161 [Escallonia herrerae]
MAHLRYITLVQDLHRVNIFVLSANEKLAFFLNLYNAVVIHAVIIVGHPGGGVIDRRSFYSDFLYVIGGHPYSLATIKNGILRSNRRAPYSLVKPFGTGDKRLELTFSKVNPLIHFGLCNGTRSSPTVRFFSPQGVESELRYAAREFFRKDGMEVDLAKRTVYLTRIIKWYNVDFGQDKEILQWLINFLDASKAVDMECMLAEGPWNIQRALHVLIRVFTYEPLLAGVYVPAVKDIVNWVWAFDEKMFRICYSCRVIGHVKRGCSLSIAQGRQQVEVVMGCYSQFENNRICFQAHGALFSRLLRASANSNWNRTVFTTTGRSKLRLRSEISR